MFKTAEERRLDDLKGLHILDTPEEPEFDIIVKEAARMLDAPIALISLVDEDRQWFKARVGLEARSTARSISLCDHAIKGPEVFIVQDASLHEQYFDNPLVTGDPSLRFYAGAPLTTSGGSRIGTICVIDRAPRSGLSEDERQALEQLARRTVIAFESRRERLPEDPSQES